MTDRNAAPSILITEYAINALHADARVADWWNWNVYLRRTRRNLDQWTVTTGHEYYDADGQPHGTVHEAGVHARPDAVRIAMSVASTMQLMGETAEQASARILAHLVWDRPEEVTE